MADSFKTKLKTLRQKMGAKKPSERAHKPFFPDMVGRFMPKSGGIQSYRIAFWNTHMMSYMVAVLLISNVVLAIALSMAYPLKTITPMLVQAKGKEDVYVTVTPLNASVHGYDVILESMAQKYITLREGIDLVTDGPRWNEVKALSSNTVWQPFLNLISRVKKITTNA